MLINDEIFVSRSCIKADSALKIVPHLLARKLHLRLLDGVQQLVCSSFTQVLKFFQYLNCYNLG